MKKNRLNKRWNPNKKTAIVKIMMKARKKNQTMT